MIAAPISAPTRAETSVGVPGRRTDLRTNDPIKPTSQTMTAKQAASTIPSIKRALVRDLGCNNVLAKPSDDDLQCDQYDISEHVRAPHRSNCAARAYGCPSFVYIGLGGARAPSNLRSGLAQPERVSSESPVWTLFRPIVFRKVLRVSHLFGGWRPLLRGRYDLAVLFGEGRKSGIRDAVQERLRKGGRVGPCRRSTTIGRLMRIGCAIMKSMSSSSLHFGSPRPSSS